MAKKGSGSAGGAKLATGYISLNVRYASAMGQIASDFDSIDKRAKSTGESITKNLVAGADKAKAEVKALGEAYEAQRAKVNTLKEALSGLQAKQSAVAALEKQYAEARQAQAEREHADIRRGIELQDQLSRAMSAALSRRGLTGSRDSEARKAAIAEDSAVQAIYKKQEALNAKRKKDTQDLARLEKELGAARSAAKPELYAKGVQAINVEIAKGRTLLEQYGKATEDAARKQQLATATMGQAVNEHRTFGQRISQAFSGTFVPQMQAAGTKGVNAFRQAFNQHMSAARAESTHHGKQIASGLLMGLTPQFLTAAGAGLAIGAAFKSGFSRLEDIDTAKLKLEALGYSAADVSATTGAAMNSVIGTAYSFADAMNAATVSMAAGIKPGADLEKHLTLIANAAALTGADYATMAETINRVTQFGVLSQREIRPLVSHNIPVLQWLKDYYVKQTGNQKITIGDIRDMITNKMITADVFEKVMGEHLEGMAKDLGRKTVTGAFKNMWVQVGKVTASMIEPVFGSIPGAINKVADTLSRWSEQIKPIMGKGVDWIKKKWTELSPALGKTIEWIKDMWAKMWPHVHYYIDKFVTMWREMWPQLMTHVQPLLGAFRRLWDALWPIVKPIVALAGVIAYEFIKHMPAIAQFATNLINWLATAVDWLRTKFWPWLKDSWKKFTEDVTGAWNTVKTFSEKVIGFFDNIKTRTEKTWDWLIGKFKWMKDNIPGLTTLLKALGISGPDVALTSASTPLAAVNSGGANAGMQVGTIAVKNALQSDLGISIGGGYRKPDGFDEHSGGNAFDVMVKSKAEGDRVAADALRKPGVDFVIWQQRTWRPDGSSSPMPDRGSPTANHMDHVHVHVRSSGYASGAGPESTGLPRGSNAAPYPSSPAVSLTSGSVNPLWDKIARAESSGRWNDNNSGGHSTSSGSPRGGLQITDGTWKAYGGLQFAPNAAQASKADQITVAKRIAFTGWNGVAPQGLSAWQAITEGKVPGVNASMSASDFGGIQNLDYSTPIIDVLNGGGPQTNPLWAPLASLSPEQMATLLTTPASTAPSGIPWSPGGTTFPSTGGNPLAIFQGANPVDINQPLVHGQTVPGQAQPGRPGGFWGSVSNLIQNDPLMPQWMKEIFKPRTISIMPDSDLPGAKGFDSIAGDIGLPFTSNQPRVIDTGAGHGGASGREHRGLAPLGPKGTKDDPVVTTDPKVTENTDPNNQPGTANGPDLVGPDGNPITPGGGLGGSAGAGIGLTTDADGNLVDSNGNPVKDAVTGLGDVASKAFSDQFAGTPFSDPTQWPATQSAGALLKFFGGLLTGSGGEGLAAFFPGGKGKGPSSIATRNAQAALDKKNAAIKKQQAKVDDMKGRPQFTDEAIQEQQDKLDTMIEDRDRIIANAQDRGINLGGVDSDTGAPAGWGPAAPTPFGQFNLGTPPPAPGGATNGGAVAPGGGWLGGNLPTGLIPSPSDVAPQQGAPAANVTIDNSIHQQVPLEGQANATDAANRAINTNNASAIQAIRHIPGAVAT